MKYILIFLLFIFSMIAQKNIFLNFSIGHESYDPDITKSTIVPSLGLRFNFNLTSDTLINIGLKIDYSRHSIFLNQSVVDFYGDLKSDYYRASYIDFEPNLMFYIKSDFWLRTGLGFHYLSSENINFKNSDPIQGVVFVDGYGTVNLSVDKYTNISDIQCYIGFTYSQKFKSTVNTNIHDGNNKLSSFFLNFGILIF